jgi:sigma-54 dependent transcriptional regulator, acetoin dehydrogenase operon transcriptional activator AcoR
MAMVRSNSTAILGARRRFFEDGVEPRPEVVDERVVASWRRSLGYGLSPGRVIPRRRELSSGAALLPAAERVLASVTDTLDGLACGFTLTDASGQLLRRWVADRRFTRRMDDMAIAEGYVVAETAVGTNSASVALATGGNAVIAGAMHFPESGIDMTSAGTLIRHPSTRRVLGTLNIVSDHAESDPVLLPWLLALRRLIDQALLVERASADESLLRSYESENRDARHPVICLNEHTLIANTAARRLLDVPDHAMLWDAVERSVASLDGGGGRLALSSGRSVEFTSSPIVESAAVVGATVRFTRVDATPAARADDPEPAFAGTSRPWRTAVAAAARAVASRTPLAIVGERGTGRSTLAQALVRGLPDAVVVDEADGPTPAALTATVAALAARPPVGPLVLTVLADADDRAAADAVRAVLLDWPGEVVSLPRLADRLDDLPQLVEGMSRRALRVHRAPRWSAESMRILARQEWPANLISLAAVVREALSHGPVATVTPADLPGEVVAHGTRRPLVGLELVEARAIVDALQTAQGNKSRAAAALGIDRSTLHRRLRSLGLESFDA